MTAGAWGLVAGGRETITYIQGDAHPEVFGARLLDLIAGTDVKQLVRQARAITLVDEIDPVSDDDVRAHRTRAVRWLACQRRGASAAAAKAARRYGALAEALGADPAGVLAMGAMVDADWFPLDSELCDVVYLADLDRRCVEVYVAAASVHTDGRFAGRWAAFADLAEPVYPVRLAGVWRLAALPSPQGMLDAIEGRTSPRLLAITDGRRVPSGAPVALAA